MSGAEWDWTPGVGVGPFGFGTLIQDYMSHYDVKLVRREGSSITGCGEYEIGGEDKVVWTEEGKIVCVRSDDFWGYKGKNLIGMSEEELIAHMGQDPDEIGTSV
ncbi:hypothetical protein [Roseibium salinum]|uniref:Uncharacterized protein n=1 Tax=Roseibium salinum TaxID=1604349 RepID=A0ABT3QY48_9HYPH|nr:hypothetical protein [Roseibium sp. DSM 29163]MCX2721844.1 hypothetical protein [Roseibium sp. DSM 29163]